MNRLSLPVLFLCASLLPAQETPSAPSAQTAPAAREKPTPVFVSVDFPGGTLAEFVAALRAKEPKVNVILAPLATDAKLPRIELQGAGIEQALEAACTVAESKALIRMKSFRGQGEPVFTIQAQTPVLTMKGPNGEKSMPTNLPTNVAAVIEGIERPAEPPQVEVFSLQDVLPDSDGQGLPIATVLSAIEAAVGPESQGTTLRFHKDSGVLIARGRKSQLQTVRSVLGTIESDVKQRRHDQRRADAGKTNDKPKEPK